jgi:hypothetical protein
MAISAPLPGCSPPASSLYSVLFASDVSSASAIITSISLAAIATDIRVRGGGDYYLISRTLGAALSLLYSVNILPPFFLQDRARRA